MRALSSRSAGPLLALAAGGLQALSLAPRPLWWLQLLALAMLAGLVRRAKPRRAALLGGCFGAGWIGGSVWWLYIAMHRYGDLPGWIAAPAVVALSVFLALYLAGAMALQARWRTAPGWGLGFAAWWLAAELARGTWFTGFPWAASGYSHIDGPLRGLASWIGVYGIGAIAAWLAAQPVLCFEAWQQRRWRPFGAAAVLVLLVFGAAQTLPQDHTRPAGTLSVTLLQGNIPQDEKFDQAHVGQALLWHRQALLRAQTDLVLAPETAIALLPDQLPPDWWNSLLDHFREGRTAALFGVPLGDPTQGYTNSMLGVLPGNSLPYRYDKAHLLPFGEFIPPGFRWFVDMMNMPLGDFARGQLNAPSMVVAGQRIAPSICYEDLFGEELATRFVDASKAPTLLANVSNLGWYDQSTAVPQHLQFSRMRTLEFQRPMIRAANTGATVVLDHQAQATHALAPYVEGVLVGQVEGRTGLTPYARWLSAVGLWPLWGLVLLIGLGRPIVAARIRSAA